MLFVGVVLEIALFAYIYIVYMYVYIGVYEYMSTHNVTNIKIKPIKSRYMCVRCFGRIPLDIHM